MSWVNHGFAKGLVRRFQRSEGMRRGEIYIMSIDENLGGGQIFLVKKGN
jgi:hypothetical protein